MAVSRSVSERSRFVLKGAVVRTAAAEEKKTVADSMLKVSCVEVVVEHASIDDEGS